MIAPKTYATFWTRMLAHNIDLLFILIPLFLISPLIESELYLYLFAGIYYLSFHIGFELSPWRASPGKRVLKLMIQDNNDQTVNHLQIVARNLLKPISILPFFIGVAMIGWTTKHQGLHDLISGMVVIQKST